MDYQKYISLRIKKHFILMSFLFISLPVAVQASDNMQDMDVPYNKMAFGGICYIAKEDGYQRQYYQDGTMMNEVMCINSKPAGVFKEFYHNGLLSRTVTFKDGLFDGYLRKYSQNGHILKEIRFHEGMPQLKDTREYAYYDNGNFKSMCIINNGNGFIYEFYKDGRVKAFNSIKADISFERIEYSQWGEIISNEFVGGFGFDMREFQGSYNLDAFIEALKKRGIQITKGDEIVGLNDLLLDNDLYKKYTDVSLTARDTKLLNSFSKLPLGLKREFNRRLMERGDPQYCPKNVYLIRFVMFCLMQVWRYFEYIVVFLIKLGIPLAVLFLTIRSLLCKRFNTV